MTLTFQRARYVSLVTFRRTGVGVPTPVWFAIIGRYLYVFSAAGAGKVKRLRHSAEVRVAPCEVGGRPRGEWVDARAVLVEDSGEEARAYRALRDRYGWQMRVADFFSRLTGRIEQRQMIRVEHPRSW